MKRLSSVLSVTVLSTAFALAANAGPKYKVGEFFSFTLYDNDGYLMDGNTSINSYNMETNEDGTYTVSFNCGESAINNITSTGREFNYIVRAYAASEIVRLGQWNPVSPSVLE